MEGPGEINCYIQCAAHVWTPCCKVCLVFVASINCFFHLHSYDIEVYLKANNFRMFSFRGHNEIKDQIVMLYGSLAQLLGIECERFYFYYY